MEEPTGARWRNSGEEGGGTQGCTVEANGSIMKQPVKHSGEEGGGTQGCKVEELRGARWSDSREEGGATPGRKVEEPRGARWRPTRAS